MRKIFVVAVREYLAAVKSRAFLVSLVVMPLLMFGGIFVQRQTAKMSDIKTKRVAIVDRSPGGKLFDALVRASEVRNREHLLDRQTGVTTLVSHISSSVTTMHMPRPSGSSGRRLRGRRTGSVVRGGW